MTGTELDPSRWRAYEELSRATGENWQAGNVTVRGGSLVLRGQSDGSIAGIAWTNDQRYGVWEVHARFSAPADAGLCPVFMLWPAKDETWPAAGELDFAEIYDPDRKYLEGWLHYDITNRQSYTGRHPLDLTQWHTYSVEWRRDHVTYLVDGAPWWTTTSHVPTGPMHLAIQINNTTPGARGHIPTTVEVDSVRTSP